MGFDKPFKFLLSFKINSFNKRKYYLQEIKFVLIPLGIFLSLFALFI
jgi:hypothetical protein